MFGEIRPLDGRPAFFRNMSNNDFLSFFIVCGNKMQLNVAMLLRLFSTLLGTL